VNKDDSQIDEIKKKCVLAWIREKVVISAGSALVAEQWWSRRERRMCREKSKLRFHTRMQPTPFHTTLKSVLIWKKLRASQCNYSARDRGLLHFALTPNTVTAKPNQHAFFLLKPFTIPIISTPKQLHRHANTTKKKIESWN